MRGLTTQQKQVMQMEAFTGGSSATLTSSAYYAGQVSDQHLLAVIDYLYLNNDSLRLRLKTSGGEYFQEVLRFDELERADEVMVFSDGEEVEDYAQQLAYQPVGPKQLAYLIPFKIEASHYGVIVQLHHVAGDGWTVGTLYEEFVSLTQDPSLLATTKALENQFSYYQEQHQTALNSPRTQGNIDYWVKTFAGFDEGTYLSDQDVKAFKSKRFAVELSDQEMAAIKQYTKTSGTSIYSLYLTALSIYLTRIKGQDNFCIGTALLNRSKKEQKTMGMFVNTVGLNLPVSLTTSFKDQIAQTNQLLFGAFRRMNVDFLKVIDQLRTNNNHFKGSLYDVYLSYQNITTAHPDNPGEIKWYHCGLQPESLSININDWVNSGNLKFEFDYQVEKFSQADVLLIHQQVLSTLLAGMAEPTQAVGTLPLCDQQEAEIILTEWNTPLKATEFISVIDLFQTKVSQQPNQVALEFQNQALTYHELDRASSALAELLREHSLVKREVVLHLSSGLKQIIAILAVLKAGAAYVPIDTTLPVKRKEMILAAVEADVVLVDQAPCQFESEALLIEVPSCLELIKKETQFENRQVAPTDPAYLLFTSGTTGTPKGVVVTQENLSHYGLVAKNYFNLDEQTKTLQQATYAFDIYVEEVFPTLLAGGTVVIFPREDSLSFTRLKEEIIAKKITMISATPLMLKELSQLAALAEVEIIISGGDVLEPAYVAALVENGQRVYNTYGPTETTVCATYHQITLADLEEKTLPLGQPLENVQVYTLVNDNLAGVNIPGEICIAGRGVASGYLNDQEQTAEKFIPNPFGPGKLYRTGDLGRFNQKGQLEFLGRLDQQVKIRGYRVELNEIEGAIRKFTGVKDVFLRLVDRGENSDLWAYLIADQRIKLPELKQKLRRELAEYMIPSQFLQVAEFPLNINGKIAVNLLPELTATTDQYVAPETEIEIQLAQLIAENLNLDQVGREADFFKIGGHSLKGMQLATKIKQVFNVELSLRQLFQTPVVSELAAFIQTSQPSSLPVIRKAAKAADYPVTPAQKRIYLVEELQAQDAKVYNMAASLKFAGRLDFPRLQQAFVALANRHTVLRSTFKMVEGEIRQEIQPKMELVVETLNFDFTAESFDLAAFSKPFDLATGPLIRLGVQLIDAHSYQLFFDMHHIISDGLSLGILFTELDQLYRGEELLPLSIQYPDYSVWLTKKDQRRAKDFWLNYLTGFEERLDFPLDYPRPKVQTYAGKKIRQTFSAELSQAVYELARELETTPYVIFSSLIFILLHKYTGQTDLTLGSGYAGRDFEETEGLIGLLVNTLVLRGHVSASLSYREFVAQLKLMTTEMFDFQDYPFEQLLSDLGVQSEASRHPLFDVMYTFQNDDDFNLTFGDSQLIEETYDETIAKFDLQFEVIEKAGQFQLELIYNTDLFLAETMEFLKAQTLSLLNAIVQGKNLTIRELSPVSQEERQLILTEFNQWEFNETLPEKLNVLFEQVVQANREKIALTTETESFTYGKLFKQAQKLALQLKQDYQLGQGDKIAIIAEKNAATLIAILATVAIDGIYVPIDPLAPMERQQLIFDDIRASVKIQGGEIIPTGIKKEPSQILADPIAYVMYTSGTTGRPRGVMIKQSSIVRLVEKPSFTSLNKETVILQTGSLAFDAATFEIWGAFLHGAKLVMVKQAELLDSQRLTEIVRAEKVNFMFTTTAFFNFLVEEQLDLFATIEQLYVGGEVASKKHMTRLLQANTKIKLANIYGPTENTTFSTAIPITLASSRIPIGYPLSDTGVYILQEDQLAGVGMVGEICLTGDGIAAGYYNLPALSEEKFRPNPFGGGKMYRTGDVGRFLADGSLEYLGRLDDQVKIRGYRIELAEIQLAATNLPGVGEAFVTVLATGETEQEIGIYLVADQSYTLAQLNQALSQHLPTYMLPQQVYQLDQLPLNQNGKVDTKALPQEQRLPSLVTAPVSEMEKLVARCYADVLEIEEIGRDDDFFALGGHSLKAMQVANRISQELGIKVELRDFFAHLQVASLANFLESQQQKEYAPITKAPLASSYPLSAAQKRMYLIQKMQNSASLAYNMPLKIKYEGEFNLRRLERAFNQLIANHDILRTRFVLKEGLPVQEIRPLKEIKIQVFAGKNQLETVFEKFVRPFDLAKDQLIRVAIYKDPQGNYLLFDMHHIISDGFSVKLLTEELSRLYQGQDSPRQELQYYDYSTWLEEFTFEAGKDYWEREVLAMPEIFDLPHDYPRSKDQQYAGRSIKKTLSKELSQLIDHVASQHQLTPYMFFASVMMILLAQKSNQRSIRFGVPVAGRVTRETEKMLGLFVNTVMLQNEVTNETLLTEFFAQIKEKALGADQHQAYPFDRLIDDLKIETDSSRNPLFDVMFSFQTNEGMNLRVDDVEIIESSTIETVTKFDFNVDVIKEQEQYQLDFMYRTDLFKHETISGMLQQFELIVDQLTQSQAGTIGDLALISEADRGLVLHAFNPLLNKLPTQDLSLIERFYLAVRKFADHEAINDEREQLSYRQLARRVKDLALRLKNQGAQPGDLIAIYAEQNINTIVSILAVLDLEMAYLLIDVEMPLARQDFLFEDGDVQFYLKESRNRLDIIPIATGERKIKHQPGLAYIMYTSGTTGKPKGVQITQENIISFIYGEQFVPLNQNLRVLHTSAMSFDATTFEIFGTLLFGGTLTLVPTAYIVDPASLSNLIHERQINCIFITTALFNFLIAEDQTLFAPLTYLLIGGEKASLKHMGLVKENSPGVKIYNMYGPTETTTFATAFELPEKMTHLPIGRPIMGKEIYVLNNSRLAGIGIPGEICIGGAGVSPGYLNQPDLNESQFVPNPFGSGMLYRSGDIGYWAADGNLIYLNRQDAQVKIRGFRIELSEIEAALVTIDQITAATVTVEKLTNQDSLILAYFVATESLEVEEVKQTLRNLIPNYMVPTKMQQIEQIPLNKNGKVDYQALPEIKQGEIKYTAAETPAEEILLGILAELVGQAQLNRQADFFEIGGDSIKAMRLVSLVREAGYDLTIEDVIKSRRLDLIAQKMNQDEVKVWSQVEYQGDVALSAIQKEWLSWEFPNKDFFTQGVMLHHHEKLEREGIRKTLEELILTHDNLRLTYQVGSPTAQIKAGNDLTQFYQLIEQDLTDLNQAEVAGRIRAQNEISQRELSLSNGPLISAILYQTAHGSELFLSIHHLVVDGVSWRILLNEFNRIYTAITWGMSYSAPLKTASYGEWIQAQNNYLQSEAATNERYYWHELAAKSQAKWDQQTLAQTEWIFNEQQLVLPINLTREIIKPVQAVYQTELNDILVSGVVAAFATTFQKAEVIVELEGHGRQGLAASLDVSQTVGWFTSIYPVVIDHHRAMPYFIRGVKNKLSTVPNGGSTYLPLRHSQTPIPEIPGDLLFNYLGNFDTESIGNFTPSKIDSGLQNDPRNHLKKPLMINASVKNQQLEFALTYNRALISVAEITEFTRNLSEYFSRFIKHLRDLQENSNLEWLSKETLAKLEYKQILQAYDQALVGEKLMQREPISFAQKIFIEQTAKRGLPICASVVEVDQVVPKKKILGAINAVIASQPALRQSLNENQQEIFTYSKERDWPIPYFTCDTQAEKYLIVNKTAEITQSHELFEGPGLLAKHLVFANDDGTHTIYIYAHHGIWDLSSIDIWQSELNKYLRTEINLLPLAGPEEGRLAINYDQVPLSEVAEEFLDLTKGYFRALSLSKLKFPVSLTLNKFKTYRLSEVVEKVQAEPLITALELMEMTVRTNTPYKNRKIPFFVLSHGRNALNQNKIGLYLELQAFIYKGTPEAQRDLKRSIQGIWTGENLNAHNFEVLSQQAGLSERKMLKILNRLPIINVSSFLEGSFTEAFEEQTENAEAFGETIGSIQLQLRKDVVKIVVTSQNDKMEEVCHKIDQLVFKNKIRERLELDHEDIH